MKKLLLILLGLCLFTTASFAQKPSVASCCIAGSQETATLTEAERAMYASHEFAALHLAPLPFTYSSEHGDWITFKTPDGSTSRAFMIPATKPTNKYLLVYHEWWGLNDYIRKEAESWQKELGNVNVIAIDLFDGKVATTPEEAQKQTQGADPKRMSAIIQGALDHIGPKARVASLGWCFGGGWALQSSILAGKRGAATVMYYGMPEYDQAKLKKLNGPVIEFFGGNDAFINSEKETKFKQAMKQAKRSLETHTYNGAEHGFANPSNPKYDKPATADAHKRALAFLKKKFVKM